VIAKDIALWLGIAGAACGVYFPISARQEANRQADIQRATEATQRDMNLSQHLTEIDKHLEFIDDTLPQERQQIAHEVFKQVTRVEKAEIAKRETSEPIWAQHGHYSTGVSADAPAEEKPK